ncbi:MAG: hypothetical protein IJ496_03740 [Ruminococcus sp.]|nr:hypothetical protein [Ruminococcus sp.]
MKRWIAFLSAAAMLAVNMPVSAESFTGELGVPESAISINETNFPDAVFREYISTKFDENGDGCLEDSEIWTVRLDLYNVEGITSLKGIELLENLWYLNAGSCPITEIDVSNNMNLEELCLNNCTQLTEIDVSRNPNLTHLEIGWTQIAAVDVSRNPLLEAFCCTDTLITELDVTNNPALTFLHCDQNAITSLDLSKNPLLEDLDIYKCSIPELDLSNNPALKSFSARESGLTRIDFSGCPALESVELLYNEIPEIDVTGCPELRYLYVDRNPITSIDVTGCPKLKYLSVQQIDTITEIDVTKNPDLINLQVSGDGITELDITQNSLLETLNVGCSITELDVTDKPNLTRLDCRGSGLLTELDVSKNPLLEYLYLDFCSGITALDLSNNPLLETLWCTSLPMGYINLENQTALTDFCAPRSIGVKPDIVGETLDLSEIMPENFDASRMVNIGNATLEGSVLTILDPTEEITYEYDSGYSGETLSFSISIGTVTCTSALAEPIETQTYTGQPVQPEITLVCGQKVIEPEYYTVEYQNNTETGTAAAVVTMTDTKRYLGEFTIPFEIVKAFPEYTVPTGLKAVYGDTLSSIALPEGFTWENPESPVGNAGTSTATVTYTPEDTENYQTVTGIEMTISVAKALPFVNPVIAEGSYTGGDAVPEILLTKNDTPGTISWSDGTPEVLSGGQNILIWEYVPEDTTNYKSISGELILNAKMDPANGLLGDVNLDGIVNITDATLVLSYYAQQGASLNPAFSLDPEQDALICNLADIDGDGVIEISDATLILTYYARFGAGLYPEWDELIG